MEIKLINLQLFAEGGAAGASGAAGSEGSGADGSAVTGAAPGNGSSDLSHVVYGKAEDVAGPEEAQTAESKKSKTATFEELIKGEYREEFSKRTQAIVNERLKNSKATEERLKKASPLMAMLAQKYGVEDAEDIEAITKAVQDDDSFYEEAAMAEGLTVKQYKQLKAMERENAELREAQKRQEEEQHTQEIYSKWIQEGEALKQRYGLQDFSLEAEVQNPDFTRLLAAGISVEGAYKAIHFDDMIGGAMAQTASNVREQLAQSVQERHKRPTEGSLIAQSATTFKTDVNALTKADREEIERRAARGEIIRF